MGLGKRSIYLQPLSIMDADVEYDCRRSGYSDHELGLCIPQGHNYTKLISSVKSHTDQEAWI